MWRHGTFQLSIYLDDNLSRVSFQIYILKAKQIILEWFNINQFIIRLRRWNFAKLTKRILFKIILFDYFFSI
jgi:hypothetical protein